MLTSEALITGQSGHLIFPELSTKFLLNTGFSRCTSGRGKSSSSQLSSEVESSESSNSIFSSVSSFSILASWMLGLAGLSSLLASSHEIWESRWLIRLTCSCKLSSHEHEFTEKFLSNAGRKLFYPWRLKNCKLTIRMLCLKMFDNFVLYQNSIFAKATARYVFLKNNIFHRLIFNKNLHDSTSLLSYVLYSTLLYFF